MGLLEVQNQNAQADHNIGDPDESSQAAPSLAITVSIKSALEKAVSDHSDP